MSVSNDGGTLERFLAASNTAYKLQGKALINKIEVQKKEVRRGGKRKMIYAKKSTVDFTGIMRGGRHVAYEAKEVTGRDLFPYSRLEPHQREHLEKVAELGGYAFVVIYFKRQREMYLLTIQEIQFLEKNLKYKNGKPKKSVSLEWLREHKAEIKSGRGVPFDYLDHL